MTNAFSKRHYVKVAQILALHTERAKSALSHVGEIPMSATEKSYHEGELRAVNNIMEDFASVFEADNERFDLGRFLTAVKGPIEGA